MLNINANALNSLYNTYKSVYSKKIEEFSNYLVISDFGYMTLSDFKDKVQNDYNFLNSLLEKTDLKRVSVNYFLIVMWYNDKKEYVNIISQNKNEMLNGMYFDCRYSGTINELKNWCDSNKINYVENLVTNNVII